MPLKASACPVCAGLLERRFTTAPAVLRGAQQGAEVVTSRLVERAAADEFDALRAVEKPAPASGTQTRPLGIGAVPQDARLGSRMFAAPVIASLRGRDPRAVSDYKPRPQ